MMTEINLFDDEEPLKFKHILIYPYPDLRRLWVRTWLPAKDAEPNVEMRVYNPDGSENNSLVLLAQSDTKLNHTLHLKDPLIPGGEYRVEAILTTGFGEQATVVDRQSFPLRLEFRNPEAGEMGFGVGLEDLLRDDQPGESG
jgi:hypothetical protein